MTSEEQTPAHLEENVRRLFGRLERGGRVAETPHDRILEKLLAEAPAPRSRGAGRAAGRWMRWAGLAAALFVAAGLLTGELDRPGESRGRSGSGQAVGSAPTEPSDGVTLVSFAIHLLASGPGGGVVAAAGPEGEPVLIHPERHVSNADVESASVHEAEAGCQVEVRLTDEGTGKLARLTRGHVGERLALVIDDEVVMSPTIRSEITEGLVLLTGDFSDSRCDEIARGLST